ncbi:hypothetical protein KP803_04505 [Vibrio sp. ZSDE26]|uniref:Outer membrane protein beta-barrel domain-containing protein n=1 Tax=Vibrio amylolyticus TaxID=2847292 RepID=A0A9X1XI52_9VIBR|nr:hypothetical protein [Vibrio amylolyticus]MCK6262530.1 hypothetical protein [Vibrio amylolyticus]
MKKLLISLALLCSSSAFANTIHISPDMRIGPYTGSGISGGGIQIGLADTFGLDAIYVSYSHTSAEFLTYKDRLKTYRIGGQYQFVSVPKMALQLEAGVVEYEGSKDNIWGTHTTYTDDTGASISASWVVFINDNIGFRAGADFNYLDRNKTDFGQNISAMVSTGIVFQF